MERRMFPIKLYSYIKHLKKEDFKRKLFFANLNTEMYSTESVFIFIEAEIFVFVQIIIIMCRDEKPLFRVNKIFY